jgi:hypothetical protein
VKASVTLPLRTKNPNNNREHWRVVWRRSQKEREQTLMFVRAAVLRHGIKLPVLVTLTRISAGELDDDNLRSSGKSVRDGVADVFGIPDNDPRIRFAYAQEKCKPKTYGVRIELESL